MPIVFIDNYSPNNLKKEITKQDGSPLEGEIWLYSQFLNFNDYNLLPHETWYLKHNYNLSKHPASKGKVEGQIDFLLLSKDGLLVIEVKGGGLRVDDKDCYYSRNATSEYQTQNPFNQAKEYLHTLNQLMDKKGFIYRAVVLPFEAGFELNSIQLSGYKDIFFSKKKYKHLDEDLQKKDISELFFEFISELANKSKRKIIQELNPGWSLEKVNKVIFEFYPELKSKEIQRLKTELFPTQNSYGYNPDRINSEIILEQNYETLKGLRRNHKVMIQGAPGTGKTVLATKFIAENLLKQHKGIFFCANLLLRSRLEHIITTQFALNSNFIEFRVFSKNITTKGIGSDIDFLVFDEAQEYFNTGLFDFIEKINIALQNPKLLVLFDPNQSIISDSNDLTFYTDYFIENGYTHYLFDEIFRCIQHEYISTISKHILINNYSTIERDFPNLILKAVSNSDKRGQISDIINEKRFTNYNKIILIHSNLIEKFREFIKDNYKAEIEELTESNINQITSKIRFTTPIKYKGLENKAVYLVTDELSEKSKVQNYVAVTRAMESINIILWTM